VWLRATGKHCTFKVADYGRQMHAPVARVFPRRMTVVVPDLFGMSRAYVGHGLRRSHGPQPSMVLPEWDATKEIHDDSPKTDNRCALLGARRCAG
jgi:hypothetical protein